MSIQKRVAVGIAVILVGLCVFFAQRVSNSTPRALASAQQSSADSPSARLSMPLWLPPNPDFHVTWIMCIVASDGKPAVQMRMRHEPTGAVIEQTQTVDRFFDAALSIEQRHLLQSGKRRWIVFQKAGTSHAYLYLGRIRLSIHTSHPQGQQIVQHLCQQYANIYKRYERSVGRLSGIERALTRAEFDVCEYPQQLQ